MSSDADPLRWRRLASVGGTGRPVQDWARLAGWAALLFPLPSVLWRVAMMAGLPVGFAYRDLYVSSSEGLVYVIALELIQVGVALLCLGLIRPWGEVVPAWVPGLGGRVIHRALPTLLGGLGAGALMAILLFLLDTYRRVLVEGASGGLPTDGMSAAELTVLAICYVPFFAWPIPIAVAVVGYWARRRPD